MEALCGFNSDSIRAKQDLCDREQSVRISALFVEHIGRRSSPRRSDDEVASILHVLGSYKSSVHTEQSESVGSVVEQNRLNKGPVRIGLGLQDLGPV
jgi:uncharacterized protein YbgA (DUF1722 family)